MAAPALRDLVLVPLNHVMRSEEWPLERLKKHAGAEVLVESGPLHLSFRLDELGQLSADVLKEIPDVTLTLPADAPLRLIGGREKLFSAVRLSGTVEVAETLAFVMRNLRYDLEGDLSTLIGDIPAHRLMKTARALGYSIQQALTRTGENFAEYFSEDSAILAAKADIGAFGSAVDVLRDDVARLEKRLARL